MSEFPQSRTEAILQATINGDEYKDYPQSRIEELLIELKAVIEAGGGGADGSWIGITTTPLTDGASTNPITIAGESVTAVAGNITSYDNEEFIFNGSVWQSFGKLSGLISRIVALEGNVGNLSNLSTETKSSLVAAINEVVGDVSGIEAVIPEGATSSNKLATENDIPSLTDYIQKSQTAGLLKNDGTVDTNTYATTAALADKVDKVSGKGLSENDYTTTEKNKLAGLANYDDTSITNRVTAIEEVIPEGATSSNQLATQSDLPSAVIGNPEESATAGNLTKLQIGSDIFDVPSGGGSSDPYDGRKTRYTISSSNWSSSPNSDGYYTYSLTLTNPLTISTSPNVYIAGASDSTQPTATESTMFSYVKRCNLSSSTTLVLYASTKPTSTFYVFVGAEGGGSSLSAFTAIPVYDNRVTRVSGGYYVEGNKVFIQETVDVKSGLFTGTSEITASIFNIPQGFPIPLQVAIPLKAELWVGSLIAGQATYAYDSSARIKKFSTGDTYIEVRFPADIIPTPSNLHLTVVGEYYYQ